MLLRAKCYPLICTEGCRPRNEQPGRATVTDSASVENDNLGRDSRSRRLSKADRKPVERQASDAEPHSYARLGSWVNDEQVAECNECALDIDADDALR